MIHNDILKEIDKRVPPELQYTNCGNTIIGFVDGVDTSRLVMVSQNAKQFVVPLNPEFPRIDNGFTNEIGKYNRGAYLKLDGTWKVMDKISKFGIDSKNDIYMLVLYNELTHTYTMIEKSPAENLTEKFGFAYNTDAMDALQPGDIITDKVLYKSTSYDDDMNYRYGLNGRCAYFNDPCTMEDSIRISESFAKRFQYVEVDNPQFIINSNDIPLNLYGDDEEYKVMPDIGEHLKDSIICATKQIHNDNLFYDTRSENLREPSSTDKCYFSSKDGIVYDLNIYCNNPDGLPDNVFFRQLKSFHEKISAYNEAIKEWGERIKASGENYTENVPFYLSNSKHWNDPNYKWVLKDREFDNCAITINTMAVKSCQKGYKLVGRYGDKGVVSSIPKNVEDIIPFSVRKTIIDTIFPEEKNLPPEKYMKLINNIQILPDDLMPFTLDGKQLDIICNASGATRRLNTDQIHEVELNFIAEKIWEYIKTLLPDYKMIEKEVFRFLSKLNEKQYTFNLRKYESYDFVKKFKNGYSIKFTNDTAKRVFLDDIIKNGFYLYKPLCSDMRYDLVKSLYDEYPWIQPETYYIMQFGMMKKLIKPIVAGPKYFMCLKQTTEKNFSARSTSRLNKKNLPEKSPDKKNNRTTYSKNPIRIGEVYNLVAPLDSNLLIKYDFKMRSSPMDRHSLKKIIETTGDPLDIQEIKIKSTYTNTNALIAKGYLKCLGILVDIVLEEKGTTNTIEVMEPLNIIGKAVVWDFPSQLKYYKEFLRYKRSLYKTIAVTESYEGERDDIYWSRTLNDEKLKKNPKYNEVFSMVISQMHDPKTFERVSESIKTDKKLLAEYEKLCKEREAKKAEEAVDKQENQQPDSESIKKGESE